MNLFLIAICTKNKDGIFWRNVDSEGDKNGCNRFYQSD